MMISSERRMLNGEILSIKMLSTGTVCWLGTTTVLFELAFYSKKV